MLSKLLEMPSGVFMKIEICDVIDPLPWPPTPTVLDAECDHTTLRALRAKRSLLWLIHEFSSTPETRLKDFVDRHLPYETGKIDLCSFSAAEFYLGSPRAGTECNPCYALGFIAGRTDAADYGTTAEGRQPRRLALCRD